MKIPWIIKNVLGSSFATIFFLTLLLTNVFLFSQDKEDRFVELEKKLAALAQKEAGLRQKVDISFSDVSLQEYLRALAKTNDLNISVDPKLDLTISNSFSDETASNIILFLCKQYDLDIKFVGSIMSFSKYKKPEEKPVPPEPKKLNIEYDTRNSTLSYDLQTDSLGKVAKKITVLSGKNIGLAPGLSGLSVSGFTQQMKFDDALDKLAFENGLLIDKQNDKLYVINQKKEEKKENSSNTVPLNKNGTRKSNQEIIPEGLNVDVSILPGEETKITIDAVNVPIADVIKTVSKKAGVNHLLFSEPKGNITSYIKEVSYNTFLDYILQGTDFTHNQQEDLYLIGERRAEGFRNTKLFQLQFRSADTVVALIPQELKSEVELTTFSELNSIIISGSERTIAEIETFVNAIDQVVPMILIEVIVLDINRSSLIEKGFSLGVGDEPVKTQGTLFPTLDMTLGSDAINDIIKIINSTGLTNLGFVNSNLYATLKLLEDEQLVKIKSTPKLSTLNGHAASMRIGQTRYFKQTQSNIVGTQNPQTIITEEYREAQADLSINIRPVVSGDEQVTLEIEVELSSFVGTPPPNSPPPSATRAFNSVIRVKNEETIILGGLSEDEISDTGRGVPFLSRIPILKWFFSNRSKNKRKSELVVLMKPTIIY